MLITGVAHIGTPLRTRITLCRHAGFLYTHRRSLESLRRWRQTGLYFFKENILRYNII